MAKKYLDNTGLSTLWNIIKNALNLKLNINGDAYRASSIPFGQVDSTSTATVFTATVEGITELRDGVCMWLKNGVVTSASGFTININGLGAKPVYSNLGEASRSTTIFNVAYTMLFVYNESRVAGGCWDIVYGYDSNTNTIGYQVRHNSGTGKASAKTYGYRLLFTGDDDTLVPANTSSSTNATSTRAVNQTPIDPFGAIYYYGSTSAVDANSSFGAASLWQQYALNLGYSFNKGDALTLAYPKAVYIKATPTSDNKAIIDADTPYVQTLPTTEDGDIYIYLGQAYSATNVELDLHHPIYYFYNGKIQLWTGIKAEENQNAFSNIKIDSTVVSADSKTDTLELTAGNNITLTPDTTNDIVTIAATDTTYSAGTGLSLSGTTFSNSGVTGIKGNNESNYRTGQINLTPHDIGASYGVNEVLNPFAPETSYKVRIDRLENAFYFADKRWTVTAIATDSNNVETSLTSSQIESLFDMKEGDLKNVPANGSLVITIDFGENLFPNYPYGEVYLNFYYNRPPKTVSARVYGKHTGTEFYWANLSCNIDSRSNNRTCRYVVNQQSMYNMRKIEFTITADSEIASLSDIAYYLTRADKNKDMPYVSKLRAETLYYNLTAPKVTTPIVETGNTAQSYFQTERLRGEGEASTYYHAIDFGRHGHNQVDFYEYGGVFNFHKHTGATINTGDTLLGTINNKGWDGKVNNHTINADVPADAMFTDTTYSEATATASGLMSATDKAHLDAIYNDYSSALTALGVN